MRCLWAGKDGGTKLRLSSARFMCHGLCQMIRSVHTGHLDMQYYIVVEGGTPRQTSVQG
jgi:hypothetical protein